MAGNGVLLRLPDSPTRSHRNVFAVWAWRKNRHYRTASALCDTRRDGRNFRHRASFLADSGEAANQSGAPALPILAGVPNAYFLTYCLTSFGPTSAP